MDYNCKFPRRRESGKVTLCDSFPATSVNLGYKWVPASTKRRALSFWVVILVVKVLIATIVRGSDSTSGRSEARGKKKEKKKVLSMGSEVINFENFLKEIHLCCLKISAKLFLLIFSKHDGNEITNRSKCVA